MSVMSEVITGEYCRCDCHEPGRHTVHCFPCCQPCPFCYRNIKMDLDQHKEQCALNPKNEKQDCSS
jgi:hypothetical protein